MLKGFSRFLIKFEINTQDFKQNEIFVQRFRKDYSMKNFNSKRFLNKNTFGLYVFWIMVSRSLDVSLHFNENLTISSFLYIFWKVVKINGNQDIWKETSDPPPPEDLPMTFIIFHFPLGKLEAFWLLFRKKKVSFHVFC